MWQRHKSSLEASNGSSYEEPDTSSSGQEGLEAMVFVTRPLRSSLAMLILIVLFIYCSWSVYYLQCKKLPAPLTAELAGKQGFSEVEAVKHVKALTGFGPHPVGSEALDHAMQYILVATEKIKSTSHLEVDVEVDQFHVKPGANRLRSRKGRTGIYADLNHIIVRISPRNLSEAKKNSILVSSHVDTVFSTGGAGDASSCISVMLELARGVSQWAYDFKSSVIFLFNVGEEEGLNGAHSFITQHPWSETIRLAVDLEAMGLGGKSGIFQAGPHPWAIENFARAAKYPSGNIIAQDLFDSGAINSATDFEVFKEVAGVSGLDFAYTDKTAVYHTKNDKIELLKPGSLQHLGENMLAFLLRVASSPDLPKDRTSGTEGNVDHDSGIYFDILGTYMIVYSWRFANMLHNSVISLSLMILVISLQMGDYPAAVSLALSCLSIVLMWVVSLGFSVPVAFILPDISSSAAVPFIASPWIVIGLFGIPSLLGALAGQHLGFLLLQKYLYLAYSKKKENLSPSIQVTLSKLEAERWIFKSGLIQWLLLLIVANYYKVGSSYVPLVWLVTPAFAYGLLEATLSPPRLPKPLRFVTLLMALSVPVVVSAGAILELIGVLIGNTVRFDRNPGANPDWQANVIVSIVVAAVVCLMLVYLLSYVHLSGRLAKGLIILASCVLFGLSIAAVWSGAIPPFTEDTVRAVNVVHVVDATGSRGNEGNLTSYVTLFSSTPGSLTKEMKQVQGGLKCGREKVIDFVTFTVEYNCWTYDEAESGWSRSEIPIIHVESDTMTNMRRVTMVSIDTKISKRWSLNINMEEIEDFAFRVSGESQVLVPLDEKSIVDGWHQIMFSGGKNAPTKFSLTLIWADNSTLPSRQASEEKYLLKLRTDVDRLTPEAGRVLMKLPLCSLFGKATSPFTLAFFAGLHIEYKQQQQI